MATRPTHQPRRDIKPKHVMPPDDNWEGGKLASRVRYVGNGKHKTQPPPAQLKGAWTPVWSDDGQTERCDGFNVDEWTAIEELLQQAVSRGFIAADKDGKPELREGMPTRAWAFVDDVLHEARLTGGSTYHAFPLTVKDTWPIDPHRRLAEASAPRWRRTADGERKELGA